ncbi:MAG: hypothetical protein PVJ39_07285 [Gammaproteobacteria bacterium]|jgi:hypothetical protein
MGQNAFMERYEKPNYRLHVVIFLLLVGGSLYLSTQVEHTREKTNVPALKSPVPIDSVTLNDAPPDKTITPVVQPAVTSDPRQLASMHESAPADSESAKAQKHESDQQLAKTDTDERTTATFAGLQESSEEKPPAAKRGSSNPLDAAYDEQQDRFLQTLAKTAVDESRESVEIKRIRQAILHDKPLKPEAPTKKTQSAKQKQSSKQLANAKDKAGQSVSAAKTAKRKPARKKMSPAAPANNDSNVVSVAAHKPQSTGNKPQTPQLTRHELDKILFRFTSSYNNGNINQLMSLFHDNAVTNDRSNKRGIEADYEQLFDNTLSRNLMIKNINWNVRQGRAEGAATFEVVVQPKNSAQATHYRGKIKIVAEKKSQGIYITRLLHDVKQ